MCEPRSWKRLHISEISIYGEFSVIGTRSDGEIFSSQIKLDVDLLPKDNAIIVKRGLEKLEEFRTCHCSSTEKCQKHKGEN